MKDSSTSLNLTRLPAPDLGPAARRDVSQGAGFAALSPGLPQWAAELFAAGSASHPIQVQSRNRLSGEATFAGSYAMARLRIADAVDLPAADLQRATAEAYDLAAGELRNCRAPNMVRCWNYIPHIHSAMSYAGESPANGDTVTRYMVFNAGRFDAFSSWYGSGDAGFDRGVATASGVGYMGRDLLIDVLASAVPGRPVANPRQVAPYRYSRRFGPRPPCFARATLIESAPDSSRGNVRRLLVGGTASVRGEDSLHEDDLAAQLDETFKNLDSLIGAAIGIASGRDCARHENGGGSCGLLDLFVDLRVYYVQPEYSQPIEGAVRAAFGGLRRLQMTPAELCRPELLVEIEGVAELPIADAGVRPGDS